MSGKAPGPGPTDPVAEEIEDYLIRRTEELVARGMTAEDARREAEERFGDVDAVRAACEAIRRRRERRQRRTEWLEPWGASLRLALRGLARRPAFTALGAGTLALGIGASLLVFAVFHAVLVRPLPYPDSDRLAQVWQTRAGGGLRSASPADYLDWREASESFEHLAAYGRRTQNLISDEGAERLSVGRVSANFFGAMGVPPVLGRVFGPEPVGEGSPVAVLGHSLWVRSFGADRSVLGRSIRLDDETFEVIGVMPESFAFPSGVELWVAEPHDVPGIARFPGDITAMRDAWYFEVVGRLAEGVSLERAGAEMDAIGTALAETYPDSNEGTSLALVPLLEQTVSGVRSTLVLLLGAVGLVLLIACANVANLLLVRSADRGRELAVRRAIGARTASIVVQVVSEGLVLAMAGAVGGLLLAAGGLTLVRGWAVAALPRGGELTLSPVLLLVALAAVAVTVVAFTAVPAWAAARVGAGSALGTRSDAAGGGGRSRSVLIGAQVALSVVLVLSATLVSQSLWSIQSVDVGFDEEGLVTAWVSHPDAPTLPEAQLVTDYERMLDEVRAIPGVRLVGAASVGPLSGGPGAGLRVAGRELAPNETPGTRWQVVSPDHFSAIGVPVVQGRGLTEADGPDAERVAVVNETLARAVFPDGDVVGRLINTGLDGFEENGEPIWIRVVGVVGDTRNAGPTLDPNPVMYRPLRQASRRESMMLALRTEGGADVEAGVVRAVRAVVPTAPVYGQASGEELRSPFSADSRFVLILLGAFAGLSLALGSVGIYAVTSFVVLRRTPEIGVRMALGAGGGTVVAMTLRRAMRPAVVGLGAGLLLAVLSGQVVGGLLVQEVSPWNVPALAVAAATLLGVTAVAAWVPARRAARVDPVGAIGGGG